MSRVMTKRHGRGHGHGRKNKRTMRRRRSHSAHLTRSRRHHRHGSRSRARRGGGMTEAELLIKAGKAAGLAVKGIQKYKDTKAHIRDKASREANAAAIRDQIIPSSGTFGATASNFRPSSFPSRASSKSPRRWITASHENLQVVPRQLLPVHEGEQLATITRSKVFDPSKFVKSAASSAHNMSP